ncbi:hypothetical protein Gpo141_00012997 [Globisporangium polare]
MGFRTVALLLLLFQGITAGLQASDTTIEVCRPAAVESTDLGIGILDDPTCATNDNGCVSSHCRMCQLYPTPSSAKFLPCSAPIRLPEPVVIVPRPAPVVVISTPAPDTATPPAATDAPTLAPVVVISTPAPDTATPQAAMDAPTSAPITPPPAPNTPSPATDAPAPAPDTPTPAPDIPTPAPDTQTPVPDTPAPDIPTPTPPYDTPAPDTPTPAPDTPVPDTSTPVGDTPSPAPVYDTPSPSGDSGDVAGFVPLPPSFDPPASGDSVTPVPNADAPLGIDPLTQVDPDTDAAVGTVGTWTTCKTTATTDQKEQHGIDIVTDLNCQLPDGNFPYGCFSSVCRYCSLGASTVDLDTNLAPCPA